MSNNAMVSSENERLILVDEDDNVLGYASKGEAHNGMGTLHRAFSIFIFNPDGEVLLQKRSEQKRLWPMYWSNSCCSHPREGETYEFSTARRLREELALEAELTFLYRFSYQALYSEAAGSEHELCSVYVGHIGRDAVVDVNPNEIAEWKWVSTDEVDRLLEEEPQTLTPWFKMEWARIRRDHASALSRQ
ncbi:MAG: isopentenyl-diphosphate Delta-isomerase [Myxococcota bacterium]